MVTRHIRSVGEATDNYLPLLTMVDLSKVYLETYLPANRLRDVQSGQPVEVTVPDLPGRKFAGTVEYIAPVIDPASGEFRVKILVPNEDHALRSGMGAVGSFAGQPRSDLSADTGTKTRVPSRLRANGLTDAWNFPVFPYPRGRLPSPVPVRPIGIAATAVNLGEPAHVLPLRRGPRHQRASLPRPRVHRRQKTRSA